MLIVWDSYESVLPAFNAGRLSPPEFAVLARAWTRGGSRLLVTCRDEQVGFDAKPFPLGELSVPEGLMLLVGFLEQSLQYDRARRQREGWTADDLEPIVRRTGGHPLALELLAQIEQQSPEGRNRSMWASLDFSICHPSGDTAAAAEYRRRKEAVRLGPRGRRPGDPPQETVIALLQLALTARAEKLDLADALGSALSGAGSDNPAELLAAIEQNDPWLATHLKALATGAPRPTIDVPAQFAALVQGAWEAAS